MTRQEYNKEISTHATCNWVEVRNQAAIAAMQAIILKFEEDNLAFSSKYDLYKGIAKDAVDYADFLVEELKGE